MGDPGLVVQIIQPTAHIVSHPPHPLLADVPIQQKLGGLPIGAILSQQIVVLRIFHMFDKLHHMLVGQFAVDGQFPLQQCQRIVRIELIDNLHGIELLGLDRLRFEDMRGGASPQPAHNDQTLSDKDRTLNLMDCELSFKFAALIIILIL